MRAYLRIMLLAPLAMTLACKQQATTVEAGSGQTMTLEKPSAVSVERGSTAEVTVNVDKTGFTSPVTAAFSELPAGVTVEDESRKIESDSATYVLQAGDSADLVENHQAKVTVTGPDGVKATTVFDVTVKEKHEG